MSENKKYNYEEIINDGIPNDFGIIFMEDSLRYLFRTKNDSNVFLNKLMYYFQKVKAKYGISEDIFMKFFIEIVIQYIGNKKVIKMSEESVINTLFFFFNSEYRVNNYFNLSYSEKENKLNEVIIILKSLIREKIRELEKVNNIDDLKKISTQLYESYLIALNESLEKEEVSGWNIYFKTELKKDIDNFKKFNIWIKEFIKEICQPLDNSLFKDIDIDKLRLFLAKQYLELIKNELIDNILVLDYINRTIENLYDKNTFILSQSFLVVDNNSNTLNVLQLDKYTVQLLKNEFIDLIKGNPNLQEKLKILSKYNKQDFDNLNIDEIKDYVSLILEDIKDNWQNVDKKDIEFELDNLEKSSQYDNNKDLIRLLIDKSKFLLDHKPIRIIKGEGTFKGYYGFIYPNGKIILESLYEDENKKKISYGNAIYQMNLKKFKEIGNLTKTALFEENKDIRIIHRGDWKDKLETILNEKTSYDTVLNFESINLDSVVNLEDLTILSAKLEELERKKSSGNLKEKISEVNKKRKDLLMDKINNDLADNPSKDHSLLSEREQFIQMVDELYELTSKSSFIDFFNEYYSKFRDDIKTKKPKRNPAIAAYTKKRANNKCDCCGDCYDSPQMLDSHHFIPLSKGGDDNIYNTVCLCPRCHRIAHTSGFTHNQQYILIEKIRKYLEDEDLDQYLIKFNQTLEQFNNIIEQEKFFMDWNGYNKTK